MSRSVAAPSSVTKTSPCWNGDIVPGSTFRYGSNFIRFTLRLRLSSRHPIEAAASPLPNDETTPPVTKMYLADMIRSQGLGKFVWDEVFAGGTAVRWFGWLRNGVRRNRVGVHNQLWQNCWLRESMFSKYQDSLNP